MSIKKLMVVAAMVALGSGVLLADEEKEGWSNTAELGAVITGGNSDTSTISFKDTAKRSYARGELTITAAAIKAEQTTSTARNVDGSLVVDKVTETNAESYELKGKYRGQVTERFFWYGAGGWERNQPAGIDDRYLLGAGAGYLILKDAVQEFSAELGLDYVDETYVSGSVPSDANYASARGFLGYDRKLSETATLNAQMELLQNLDTSDDLRINAEASVTASLSSKLALKVGYAIKYDKSPAVALLNDPNNPAADPVLYEFDDTDTIFSASLVINY